jgi:hypothetical protein
MEVKRVPTEGPRDILAIFRDGKLIDAAILEGARQAILAHKRHGVPVVIWKDGRIVWVDPEDLEIPPAQG